MNLSDHETTRGKIIWYLQTITDLSGGRLYHGVLFDIARKVGVSRETVRQIAESLGYTSNRQWVRKQTVQCVVCTKTFPKRGDKVHCSPACRKKTQQKLWTSFTCTICGAHRTILKSLLAKRAGLFCSKRCQGVWLGKNHGGNRKESVIERMLPQFQEGTTEPFHVEEFVQYFGFKNKHSAYYALLNLINKKRIKKLETDIYEILV